MSCRALIAPGTPGTRRCLGPCGQVKPLAAFYIRPSGQPESRCRACERLRGVARRQTPEYRAWEAEYSARPEVRARDCARNRRYLQSPQGRAWRRQYYQSLRWRLLHCRSQAVQRQRRTTDPVRISRFEATIAACNQELARLQAQQEDC